MSAPKWAERLVERVCEEAGVDQPEVTWRRSSWRSSSSGRYVTSQRRVTITAGKDPKDQRLVLLHELAHYLAHGEHAEGHSDKFWTIAWRLFARFGLARYALTRESGYKANATTVAVSLGIRGAKVAAKAAAEKRTRTRRPRGVCPMPEDRAEVHGYPTPHTHYVGTIHRWTYPADSYGHQEYIDYVTEPR